MTLFKMCRLLILKKDENKEGGAYLNICSKIKKIDEYKKTVEFTDGKEIFIDDIISIEEETK